MRRWSVRLAAVAVLAFAIPAALAASFTFTDTIGTTDPLQKGQLVRDDPATTCAVPTTAAVENPDPVHYDVYGFRNSSDSTQCVTVELAPGPLACPAGSPLQSAAYSPSFDPSHITDHYLGDSGADPSSSKYSFTVGPGASFEVTVNETSQGTGCNSYTLTVTGDGITGSPTAVGLVSFTATRVRRGVLLRWRTGSELETLGFNVYGEDSGRRIRLNRSLISGGAWLAVRRPSPRYWLQELRVDGSRTWYGPAAGH